MKTAADIEHDLEALARDHYYGEDYEVAAAVEAYAGGLGAEELDLLKHGVRARLARDASQLHAIFASVLRVDGADALLAEALAREPRVSQRSRALIQALTRFPGDTAFQAIERFVDSDQEIEALQALAAMDFPRALPMVRRALGVDHLLPVCLHILRDRARTAGIERLVEDLRGAAGADLEGFRERVAACLASKAGAYNPMPPEDARRILAGLA